MAQQLALDKSVEKMLTSSEPQHWIVPYMKKWSDENAKKLIDTVRNSKVLVAFYLNTNKLGDKWFDELVDALVANDRIGKINFCYSKLGDKATARALQKLRNKPGLYYMNLRGCELTDGKPIADFVTHCASLRHLMLAKNPDLKGAGIKPIVDAVRAEHKEDHETLQEFDVMYTGIGDGEADMLAELIADTRVGLRKLRITGNEFSADAFAKIAKAIEKSTKLTTLDWRPPKMRSDDASAIKDALQVNKSLVEVDPSLGTRSWKVAAHNDLIAALTQNKSIKRVRELLELGITLGGSHAALIDHINIDVVPDARKIYESKGFVDMIDTRAPQPEILTMHSQFEPRIVPLILSYADRSFVEKPQKD